MRRGAVVVRVIVMMEDNLVPTAERVKVMDMMLAMLLLMIIMTETLIMMMMADTLMMMMMMWMLVSTLVRARSHSTRSAPCLAASL